MEFRVTPVPKSTHCVTSKTSGFQIRNGGLRAVVKGRLIFLSEVQKSMEHEVKDGCGFNWEIEYGVEWVYISVLCR